MRHCRSVTHQILVCSMVLSTMGISNAEIKVTGRQPTKTSTSSTRLSTTTVLRSPLTPIIGTSDSSAEQTSKEIVKTPILRDPTNLSSALDFGMIDPPISDVTIQSNDSQLTMAPGETRTVPVNITRNGVSGNLYFAILFDYGDTLSADDMAWMNHFTISLETPCPADGLSYGNNLVNVRIHVKASASQGIVGNFRLIGHEVSSGAEIVELPIDVLIDGDPITASDTAMISIQSNLTNPLINGDYTIQGQPVGAFLDYNNDGYVSFSDGTPFGVYPVTRMPDQQSDLGWSLTTGGAYDNGANLVVVGMLSTWSSVDRPQFVALYLRLEGQNVVPISMWAGDILNESPVAANATSQGIVMGTTYSDPPEISVDPVTAPTTETPGLIRGTAAANVWTNTASGNLMGTSIVFTFDVPLLYDGQD